MALQQSIQRISAQCQNKWMRLLNYRAFSATTVSNNPMDPVQQIFADQVKNYRNLSEKQGGGPVDAGPEYQQQKEDAINRLKKVFSVDDPTKFPEFKFSEPDLNQDDI